MLAIWKAASTAPLSGHKPRGRDVVVKLVARYGKGAHELLVESDLAPKLLCHGTCLSDPTVSMVVMEYDDGTTLAAAKRDMAKKTMEGVRSKRCTTANLCLVISGY